MKKILYMILMSTIVLALVSCDEQLTCGEGTYLNNGTCIVGTDPDKNNNQNNTGVCTDSKAAYEVVNGDFMNAPAEPWFFIGGWMVNDPDSIWMENYNAIIFDVTDAAIDSRAVWDGAFWQPKIYTEAGYTYTVTFKVRTDEVNGREVIFFLEDTDNNYNKFFEDTVTLTQDYQLYTYEYVALTNNNDTKVGLFFANDIGTVIIDSILIDRVPTEGVPETCEVVSLYEVVNGDFMNAPAEPWFFIGGWMVNDPDSIWMENYNAIIFDVTDAAIDSRAVWDGAFWQPKIYTEAGYTYTVTFKVRTDEVNGREVIFFLEDTDNNYNKFFEDTVTLTQDYQLYTYEYVALTNNNDTKVGLFFANDIGTVIIDSIIITREETK